MQDIWVTIDGTRIPYKELTDSHILNIKKYIERRAKEWIQQAYWVLNDPDTYDVDIVYWQQVLDILDYEWICEEIKSRKI